MKHTPGPSFVDPNTNCWSSEDDEPADVPAVRRIVAEETFTYRRVKWDRLTERLRDVFAPAAGDALAALRGLLAVAENSDDFRVRHGNQVKAARAAIAKAEGRAIKRGAGAQGEVA